MMVEEDIKLKKQIDSKAKMKKLLKMDQYKNQLEKQAQDIEIFRTTEDPSDRQFALSRRIYAPKGNFGYRTNSF